MAPMEKVQSLFHIPVDYNLALFSNELVAENAKRNYRWPGENFSEDLPILSSPAALATQLSVHKGFETVIRAASRAALVM